MADPNVRYQASFSSPARFGPMTGAAADAELECICWLCSGMLGIGNVRIGCQWALANWAVGASRVFTAIVGKAGPQNADATRAAGRCVYRVTNSAVVLVVWRVSSFILQHGGCSPCVRLLMYSTFYEDN